MDVDVTSYQRVIKADYQTILNRPKRDKASQIDPGSFEQPSHCGAEAACHAVASAKAGTTPARFGAVQNSLRKVEADPDLLFHCQHCKAALVVNKSAAGLRLICQKCSQLTTVPKPEESSASASAYADEIRGKLTENESQRAEVTGYINQLTIQLHRWQLRLQTLNERKAQLEKELGQR